MTNGPVDENATTPKASAGQSANPDGVGEEGTRTSPCDQRAEKKRKWVEVNRDHVREINRRWRAEHLDRSRELNRDSMRRSAARRRREADLRAQGRERAKNWRVAHPERVREYQQRWVEENRDKVREYYNRYYANHRDEVNARAAERRDTNPGRAKEAQKQWTARNKERRAELQRRRRSDPEIYTSELAVNAAAKRLKRRLQRSGLPPRSVHPSTAGERRFNERASEAYFSDPALSERLRQFTILSESLTEHMLKNGGLMREFANAYSMTRARMGLPTVPLENIMYARGVEIVTERMRRVDLLTGRDVAAAVRSTKAAVRYEERNRQFGRLVKTVVAVMHRDGARFISDAELENRARILREQPRVHVEWLAVQIALQEVIERVPTSRLSVEDARSAARAARARVVLSTQAGPGPPNPVNDIPPVG